MEFEDDIGGGTGANEDINNWEFLGFSLDAENYHFLYTLLEGSSGRICGDTLVIYAANATYKDRLLKDAYLELIREKAEAEFNININYVRIACMDDFYHPVQQSIIDEDDIPF
ncbi:hypothetical protein N4T77_15680 [Clostridium sp. CX1]|uniref:hypothetical protein n=1 Tax=Clostridium sp. CX1 TaxID=2978346 RepID=UPI0021C0EE7D|nr:hypothetical protein [Clostridium sp. CX1]MCT8978034.1 hypothetical protein [Clostridium sp. CX1]